MSRPGLAVRAVSARCADRFRRLTPRERLLAALIAGALLLLWAGAMAGDLRAQRERLAQADALEMSRGAWSALAPGLDAKLKAKAPGLAASRALDAEATLGLLEKLLAKAGLSAESAKPATRERGLCREHTVTLRTGGATLAQIVNFRRALDASGAPMAITFLEIETGAKAEEVRARMDITALQFP